MPGSQGAGEPGAGSGTEIEFTYTATPTIRGDVTFAPADVRIRSRWGFCEMLERLGEEKAVEVVRKTLAKMSPAGQEVAAGLTFTPTERRVVEAALA